MQFAKDKNLGAELPAKKAIIGRTYACPVCGEDVYVRGGFIRVRHFAHRSGRADPDCENYHGGSAIGHPLTVSRDGHGGFTSEEPPRIDAPSLGLRVEPASSIARGDRRRWRLVFTLPKSLTGFGRLRVPTGFGTQSREIRLFALSQAAQEIDVSPNARRFGPEWISDEVDHAYRDAVSDRLEGLSPECGHAFVAGTAKVKYRADYFEWGESYYIIWKRIDFVVPDALSPHMLALYEGWSAALVTLPTTAADDVADWLRSAFALRIQETKRQWGILYPPPIEMDMDDTISVCEATSIVLGFIETGLVASAESRLTVATTVTQQQVSTRAGVSTLLHVARDALDVRGLLRLQWGKKQLPSIRAASLALDPGSLLPRVVLRIRDSGVGHFQELYLHRPEARHALDRVRQRHAELLALTVPRQLIGQLEQRSGGGPWKRLLSLGLDTNNTHREASWSVPADQMNIIVEALVDLDNDVRLTFRTYGQYNAFTQRRHPILHPRLSPDTRRRLAWYCRANGMARLPAHHPIEALSDTDLVETFRVGSPQSHLVAHRNFLEQRLRVEGYAWSVS